jgi:hypothetical protein
MKKAGVPEEDNYTFRLQLLKSGPQGIPLPADSGCLKPFLLNPADG